MEKNSCNVNFGKVRKRGVTVFNGDSATKSVEIIGQKGKYSVWTDGSSKALADLKGKTGTLREVKAAVSNTLCKASVGNSSEPKATKIKKVATAKTEKATTKPAA